MVDKRIRLFQVAKSTGGVGMYTRRLVKALDKERFQITVACLAEGAEQMALEMSQIPGVQSISIPMKDSIEPFSDFRVCLKLSSIIRGSHFDLIHAHTSKPGFFARLAAKGTGIPVIYQPANFAFHEGVSKAEAIFYAALERMAARYLTNRIIAVCDGERELARRYAVGRDDQFVTIHTGIDLEPFGQLMDRSEVRASLGIPPNASLVGTVARLTEAKAPADFIRAAAQIHSHLPAVHFVWVGDGALEAESRQLVESLGLETVFHFAGYREDIPAILKSFDCFVLSSHWEGFPLAVLEGMAAGLPVVATRVMGTPEAVCDEETGILTPIGDPKALATAIEMIVGNPTLADAFGKAGRARVETMFSYSKMVARIEALYEEVYESKCRKMDR
ncbi:MAG: glycosyltransferase family 4 protein [Anaerolineales bacterium]